MPETISADRYTIHNPVTPDGIIVGAYTQGKVGTKSIVATIQPIFPSTHIWDIRRSTFSGVKAHDTVRGDRPRLQSQDVEFAEYTTAHPRTDKQLVTVVRDPVAIAVSSLFYNFTPRNPGININSLSDKDIISRLVRGDSFSSPSFHLDWFDIEPKAAMGVDVYSQGEFPHSKGYRSYTSEGVQSHTDLLVMRLEDVKRIGCKAISEFYDGVTIEDYPMKNVGNDHPYGTRYSQFKQSVRLPEDWVKWQLDSRYASYFYTPSEREEFAQRWIEGIQSI